MGRYFIYENTPVHEITVYHAHTVEDEDRVRSILQNESETYRHIHNFPDLSSAMFWQDVAFSIELSLNLIFHKEWNVPVTFYYDQDHSEMGNWHLIIRPADSPYIETIEFSDHFYDIVGRILNDFGLDVAFTDNNNGYATNRE